MYSHGKVVAVDHALAFKYDKIAADQGFTSFCSALFDGMQAFPWLSTTSGRTIFSER
jgi:TPR repeat protein